MHDGRFETLDEVLDFYISETHITPNVDVNIATSFQPSLNLPPGGKESIIAFLKTLTDWEFVNDTSFQSPF